MELQLDHRRFHPRDPGRLLGLQILGFPILMTLTIFAALITVSISNSAKSCKMVMKMMTATMIVVFEGTGLADIRIIRGSSPVF